MTVARPRTIDAAQGKWRGILAQLGVKSSFLTGKHGPCPLCGGKDRFRFDDKDGRGTYICSGCGAGTGMDLLQRVRGWDFRTAAREIDQIVGNVGYEQPRPLIEEVKRQRILNDLWHSGAEIGPGDQAGGYLASRYLPLPGCRQCIRYVARTQAPAKIGGGSHPAMIALVSKPDGSPATLHRTFLGPNGKADLDDPRATMPGSIPDGSAIRLFPVGPRLGVAEGIETALAASVLFDMPVWAAINATMLAKWQPPEGVREVVVFGDNDANYHGAAAAYTLAHRLVKLRDLSVSIEIPPKAGDDWADVLARDAGAVGHG